MVSEDVASPQAAGPRCALSFAALQGLLSRVGGVAMAVKWSKVAPYIENGLASRGNIERSSIVDAAYDDAADDDVVDAIDTLGSRIFMTVEETKAFLLAQGAVEE
jgi:hypothetical protein